MGGSIPNSIAGTVSKVISSNESTKRNVHEKHEKHERILLLFVLFVSFVDSMFCAGSQVPACLYQGSRSFQDRIPKLELGNEQNQGKSAKRNAPRGAFLDQPSLKAESI